MPRNSYAVNMALRADSKTFSRDLDKANKKWSSFGKAVNQTGKLLGSAIKAGAIAAVAGLTAATVVGSRFEKAMSELSAITGSTGKDLEALGTAAREMAKVSSFSAGQAATAFKLVASAKPDLLESAAALAEVTKNALTLAEAAGIELPTAANALGSALNQFSADADQANRFINVLAAGSKFGASSISDVSQALKNSGVVAANLNITFEETNAALQVLASSAIKGSEAGTKFRGVLLNLEQAGGDYSVITHGLSGALKNLADDQLSVIELVQIFGKENVVGAQILLKNADAVETLTNKLTDTNIAIEQSSIQMDNLHGDYATFKSVIEELLISIFKDGGLGDALRDITRALTEMVKKVTPAATTITRSFVDITKSMVESIAAWREFQRLRVTRNRDHLRDFGLLAKKVTNQITDLERQLRVAVKRTGLLDIEMKNVNKTIKVTTKSLVVLEDQFERQLRLAVKKTGLLEIEMSDLNKTTKFTTKSLGDLEDQFGDTGDEISEIWDNMIENMQSAFAGTIHESLWEKGISTFKDFTDTLIQIWKRTISELVAAWATSRLTQFLTGSGIAATFGLGSTASAATSSTSLSQLSTTGFASAAGSAIGSTIIDPLRTAITSSLGSLTSAQGIGAAISTIGGGQGFFAGLGSSIVSSAGGGLSGLGNLFAIGSNAASAGGGIAATIGAALPAIGAIILATGIIDKLTGGAIFGRKTKLKDSGIEVVTRGERFNAAEFADFKRKSSLFGGSTKRFTKYQDLAEESLIALREANSGVFESVGSLLENLNLSSEGIKNVSTRIKISLKGLDEDAKKAAIADAFKQIGRELFAFGLAANGLIIPAAQAADAIKQISSAAEVVQAASERAQLAASGRLDTVSILTRNLASASVDQIHQLLEAARAEISLASGETRQTAEQVFQAIQNELNVREERSRAASIVGRILDRTGIVIEGLNDLAIIAQIATHQAFSSLASTIKSSGQIMNEATLALADQIAITATDYVARITSLGNPDKEMDRSPFPQFQFGGIVPGRIGTPVLAVVHGGEEVLTPEQQGRGITINVTQTVTGDADATALRALRNNAQEFAVIMEDEILQRGSLV